MPKRSRENGKPTAPALLGTTRAQILSALCGHGLTATELADQFAISSNAVRTHLGVLRGAALVTYRTEARGVGKPTHVYELTLEGAYLLSQAYAPALRHVIGAARDIIGDGLPDMLRRAGRRLARENRSSPGKSGKITKTSGARDGAEACAALIRELGGSAEVEAQAERFVIRSECCPLSSVVLQQPLTCKLFEGMARELTGRDVEEHCERAHQPHCHFIVPKSPSH